VVNNTFKMLCSKYMSRRKPGRSATGRLWSATGNAWFVLACEDPASASQKMASNHADRIQPANIRVQSEESDEYSFSDIIPSIFVNDDVVTVQFQSTNPNANDWVGAYLSAANYSLTAPIKFGRCASSLVGEGVSEYLSAGRATLSFNLTNVRSDIVFRYFTNGFSNPVLVSTSEPVQNADVNQPLRNRIVPTGDPNVFSVLWSSASSQSPTLRWGTTQGVYLHTVPASTRTISKESLCGGVATTVGWHDLGLIHTAYLTGILEHNLGSQRIHYVFGDAATSNFSPEVTFRVPPNAGMQPYEHVSAVSTSFQSWPVRQSLRSSITPDKATLGIVATSIPSRGTRVVLMADLGVGASDSTADAEVFSEACLPALNTTESIGHRVQQVRNGAACVAVARSVLCVQLRCNRRAGNILNAPAMLRLRLGSV
jgi:hypothetical protein